MNKIFSIVLAFFILKEAKAQITSFPIDSSEYKEKRIVYRANLYAGVGVQLFGSAEIKLIKNITIVPQIGTLSVAFTSNENRDIPSFVSYMAADLRYYFNIRHRKKKNKNIDFFSGNYISLRSFISSPPIEDNNQRHKYENIQSMQIHLGTQHTFKRKLTIGGNIGFILDAKEFNPKIYSPSHLFPHLQYWIGAAYVF
jgi:hypothetical protein